jgi:hypothetical protein
VFSPPNSASWIKTIQAQNFEALRIIVDLGVDLSNKDTVKSFQTCYRAADQERSAPVITSQALQVHQPKTSPKNLHKNTRSITTLAAHVCGADI